MDTLQCLAVLLVPHAVESRRFQKTKRIHQRKRGVPKRRRSRLSDADVVVVDMVVGVAVVVEVTVVVDAVVVDTVVADVVVVVVVVVVVADVMETGMET